MRLGLSSALLAASASASAMNLSEAGRLALDHDPTVAVFRAQYESDRQAGTIERADLLPSLSLKGTGDLAATSYTGAFGPTNASAAGKITDHYPQWSAKAELRQALFRFDWSQRLTRAKARDMRAEVIRVDAVAGLIARVANRYLDVVLAQDQLKQAEAEAKSLHSSLDNTRQRFDVDLVPGTDVKEAQARDDAAQAQLISARRTLNDALDAMSETTGVRTIKTLPSLRDDAVLGLPIPADPEAWVKLALENQPSLNSTRLDVEIARADAASQRAQSLPQLDLVASAGRQDSLDYIFGQKIDDARVGVELNVPIYAGGANRALVSQADANLAARQAQYEQQKSEAVRQVRTLFRSAQSDYALVQADRLALDSAIAADIATRHGYDAGTRTIIEVLDGQSRVAQANRNWNTVRYNLLSDLLGLKRAAGTLTAEDFAAVDRLLEPDVWAADSADTASDTAAPSNQ